MNKLLPCPWCGSDIELSPINIPFSDNSPCWAIWHVDGTKAHESKCPMEMGGYDTEAEAIEAWNNRVERTCEMETDHDELEVIAYSHEDTWAYKCSVCGWSFRYDRGIKPNYCPSCGRKVVD